MALKKGFCTHCKGDEDLRIFDVNKDAEVCYCPHCMAAMPPKEAIAAANTTEPTAHTHSEPERII